MTQDQVAAGMAFATNQGSQSDTVYLVKTGVDADGNDILKQISRIDYVPNSAECAPSQVAANAPVVILSLA